MPAFYRFVDRRALRALCGDLQKKQLSAKYASYISQGAFGANFVRFASTVGELQQLRHQADYDPDPRFTAAQVKIVVRSARTAIDLFRKASELEKKAFLTLLVCPPR